MKYKLLIRELVTAKGRIGRKYYGTIIIAIFITELIYTAVLLAARFYHGKEFSSPLPGTLIIGSFSLLFVVIALVLFPASIKRLHDLNKNAWYLLFLLVPFVSIVIPIYLLSAKGMMGPNEYGEKPKVLSDYLQ